MSLDMAYLGPKLLLTVSRLCIDIYTIEVYIVVPRKVVTVAKRERSGRNTEKRKPTYDLEAFKASCVKHLNMTTTTRNDAIALGFTDAEIIATIQTMERSQFYKSMTTIRDHQMWQDVYYVPSEAGM
jgi:motility quorum-sensing regulator/GCU-specific mRNA interferase toxin